MDYKAQIEALEYTRSNMISHLRLMRCEEDFIARQIASLDQVIAYTKSRGVLAQGDATHRELELRVVIQDLQHAMWVDPSCQVGVVSSCRCKNCATSRATQVLASHTDQLKPIEWNVGDFLKWASKADWHYTRRAVLTKLRELNAPCRIFDRFQSEDMMAWTSTDIIRMIDRLAQD